MTTASVLKPLSIIVPTLNEVDNISPLLSRISESLGTAGIPYEVIIIDDHSTDGTISAIEAAPANCRARVYAKQGKPGKAFSLLEGFDYASSELLCMIDADLQYPPEAIPEMYFKLLRTDADIVISERVDHETSPLRRLSTWVFNLIFTRGLFGINYDTQSGLKLFKKSVLANMTLTPSPWSFDLEFIVLALKHDKKILSHEISFKARVAGQAKIHVATAAFELAKASIELYRRTPVKRIRNSYKRNLRFSQTVGTATAIIVMALCISASFTHAIHALPLPATSAVLNTTKAATSNIVYLSDPNASMPTSVVQNLPTVSGSSSSTNTATDATAPATTTTSTNSTASTPAMAVSAAKLIPLTTTMTTTAGGIPIPPQTTLSHTPKTNNYYTTTRLDPKEKLFLEDAAIITAGVGFACIATSALTSIYRMTTRQNA